MLLFFTIILIVIGAVFPINILYPLAYRIIDHSKGRVTAITLASRLIMTAISLQIVSYFYIRNFLIIGSSMIIFLFLSMFFVLRLFAKDWLDFKAADQL